MERVLFALVRRVEGNLVLRLLSPFIYLRGKRRKFTTHRRSTLSELRWYPVWQRQASSGASTATRAIKLLVVALVFCWPRPVTYFGPIFPRQLWDNWCRAGVSHIDKATRRVRLQADQSLKLEAAKQLHGWLFASQGAKFSCESRAHHHQGSKQEAESAETAAAPPLLFLDHFRFAVFLHSRLRIMSYCGTVADLWFPPHIECTYFLILIHSCIFSVHDFHWKVTIRNCRASVKIQRWNGWISCCRNARLRLHAVRAAALTTWALSHIDNLLSWLCKREFTVYCHFRFTHYGHLPERLLRQPLRYD